MAHRKRSFQDRIRTLDKTIILLVCAAFFLLSIFLLLAPTLLPRWYANGDFFTFWQAGRMTLLGLDPYSSIDLANFQSEPGNEWIPDLQFNYPLALASLLVPIGLLPIYPAYLLWNILTITSTFVAVHVVLKFYDSKITHSYWLIISFCALVFRPAILTIRNGQISGFIFLSLSMAIYLLDSDKDFIGGLVMGISLLKPQIGGGVVLFMGIWLLFQKRWFAIFGAIVAGCSFWLIGFINNPLWVKIFLEMSKGKIDENFGLTPTFWGLADFLVENNTIVTIISVVAASLAGIILIVFLFRLRKNLTASLVMAIVIPIVLIFTPFTLAYDQIILLIPISLISIGFARKGIPFIVSASVMPLFSLLSVGLLMVALEINKDVFSALLPIVALGMVFFIIPSISKTVRNHNAPK